MINRVILCGVVEDEPRFGHQPGKGRTANFTIRTTVTWYDKGSGQDKQHYERHKVAIFADPVVGKVERELQKGCTAIIEGAIETRNWVNAQNVSCSSIDIVIRPTFGSIHVLNKG